MMGVGSFAYIKRMSPPTSSGLSKYLKSFSLALKIRYEYLNS